MTCQQLLRMLYIETLMLGALLLRVAASDSGKMVVCSFSCLACFTPPLKFRHSKSFGRASLADIGSIAASACTQPMTMAARVRSSASCQTSGHQEAVRNMGMKNVISLHNETLKKLKGTRVGIELRPARSWAIKSKRVGLTKDLEPFANTLE